MRRVTLSKLSELGTVDDYFKGRKVAYAYSLGKVKAYDIPLKLSSYGAKAAPQSFIYVNV